MLVYSMTTSLDGYVVDAQGNFDWAEPDEELHTFFNSYALPFSTFLYGRRMYQMMSFWESLPDEPDLPAMATDFARLWQAADKVVYSATLPEVTTARTRLERRFDPLAVRHLVEAATGDVSIEGPTLAAHALRAGIVDEIHQFLAPVIVGGGTPFYPEGVRIDLELLEQQRFTGGTTYLRYRSLRAS